MAEGVAGGLTPERLAEIKRAGEAAMREPQTFIFGRTETEELRALAAILDPATVLALVTAAEAQATWECSRCQRSVSPMKRVCLLVGGPPGSPTSEGGRK